ncbi:hypothetical protein [Pseudovibrio sp. Tun.PSC04-5.I4]|uniref:hypothetical protein n=1 Tax=Pseudovibrio sp. Tun.PSC04-5.I4 TaxID=1798213 RepID=UPI0008809921|nr:hypothetical protein [Pseudovibrio sp. Tun.PSC04-5.I4]SDR44988.1 hypothetical protein SAMN04515695_5487 [Pseudovibrio sp. Tun.PSC04-5.I4]
MKTARITMPHRHTVRFENDDVTLDFEVELLNDGIVLYEVSPKIIKGALAGSNEEAQKVADWLRSKFRNVEVETN